MFTVLAKTDHSGRERMFGQIDLSIGTAGHGGVRLDNFEDVKMYSIYNVKIKNITTTNQQLDYLQRVLFGMMKELPELTPEDEITIISDNNYYKSWSELVDALQLLTIRKKQLIKHLEFIAKNSDNTRVADWSEEKERMEKELESLMVKISNLQFSIKHYYWNRYIGATINIRSKAIRVVVTNLRHRFAVKVKNNHVFHRNFWAALKASN